MTPRNSYKTLFECMNGFANFPCIPGSLMLYRGCICSCLLLKYVVWYFCVAFALVWFLYGGSFRGLKFTFAVPDYSLSFFFLQHDDGKSLGKKKVRIHARDTMKSRGDCFVTASKLKIFVLVNGFYEKYAVFFAASYCRNLHEWTLENIV